MPGDALSLAMRAICCMEWGVDASKDVETLRMMQDIDGGWQDGWFYKYPSMGLQFANRGLTTALAVNALRVCASMRSVLRMTDFITGGAVQS